MKQTYLKSRCSGLKISPLSVLEFLEEVTPQDGTVCETPAGSQGGRGLEGQENRAAALFSNSPDVMENQQSDQPCSPAACYRAPRRARLCSDDSLETPKVCPFILVVTRTLKVQESACLPSSLPRP
jgi:hypothetical protein